MIDVQNQAGLNNVDIDKVGVCDVNYPIEVMDKLNHKQHTNAVINMYVDLPHQFKGTHMSRFIEVLNQYRGEITINNVSKILEETAKRLDAKSAHIEIGFKYFIEKKAPITKSPSLMGYDCSFIASYQNGKQDDFILEVVVPVMTLCPCSKEVSEIATHNQRGVVTVRLRFTEFIWIEDVVEIIEKSASCDLYTLLKRPDEKYVTERAYENPKFVEDIVRSLASELMSYSAIAWFSVKAINYESIHNHNAYAYLERANNTGD